MNFPGKFSEHILPNKVHNINVSFGITALEERYGGTAGNIAYNLSALGEKPFLISQVGNDFGDYESWLKSNGVQLLLTRKVKDLTCPVAHIITDENDNQIAGFYFGAMEKSALADKAIASKVKKKCKQKNVLGILSPGNLDDMLGLAKLYQENEVPYIFDPGQQIPWLTPTDIRTILKGASILIVNDYELAMVEKKLKTKRGKIHSKLDKLIVTLGSKGSYWYTEGKMTKMPIAKPTKVVDPTGAGDAYRAGLIKGLVEGWDDTTTAKVAALAATYSIEHYGTQEHSYSINQFKQRFYKTFKSKLTI